MLKAREPRGFRHRGARLRPAAAVSGFYVVPLYHQPEQWVGALGAYQTSREDAYIRLSAADLVARGQVGSGVSAMARVRSASTSFPTSSARGASSARSGSTRRSTALPDIDVDVRWRPFQLDPTIPPEGKDRKRIHAGQVRQRGAPAPDPRPHRAARRGRRHRLRLRRDQGLAQHARRAPRHPLGGRGRRRRAEPARDGRCSSSISRRAPISATMPC